MIKTAPDYFKEVKQIIKELAENHKKADEEHKQIKEEMRKLIAQNYKTSAEIQRFSKRTDEEMRKLEEVVRKTSEEVKRVNKSVAEIGDGFGRMTEGFALASIEEIFKKIGIQINKTLPRALSTKNGHHLEIDLLNVAKSDKRELVIVVEVKTYLRTQDVKDFLDDISKFYDFLRNIEIKKL